MSTGALSWWYWPLFDRIERRRMLRERVDALLPAACRRWRLYGGREVSMIEEMCIREDEHFFTETSRLSGFDAFEKYRPRPLTHAFRTSAHGALVLACINAAVRRTLRA